MDRSGIRIQLRVDFGNFSVVWAPTIGSIVWNGSPSTILLIKEGMMMGCLFVFDSLVTTGNGNRIATTQSVTKYVVTKLMSNYGGLIGSDGPLAFVSEVTFWDSMESKNSEIHRADEDSWQPYILQSPTLFSKTFLMIYFLFPLY